MDDDKIRVACADDNMAVRRVFRDILTMNLIWNLSERR